MQSNWLDRAIGYMAPQRGAKRVEARARIARLTQTKALYEAASLGRRTQHWRAVGTDVNAENKIALGRLRDVARDMVRNNAYAARAKATITHNVVGNGIIPTAKAGTEARGKQINDLLSIHFTSTAIDADGRLNLYGLQALAMATVVEAGEVLIRKRVRRVQDGYSLPFQIQVLEPDFLDTSVEGQQTNGNYAVQGVEFDLRGKRVAYYLFDQHPGSMMMGRTMSIRGQRVSADFVSHVFRVDRPGQVRGVSWFAPVLIRMRDWADYCDATLMRQKIASCFAAFITTEDPYDAAGAVAGIDGQPTVSPSGYPIEAFEPGMIERLNNGEKVSFAIPPTTQDFGPYSSATLHEVAAGLNIPYEAMTGDLNGVNFSSGRMGWLEFQRSIEVWRWNMLFPQMLEPLVGWTMEAATVATGSTEPFWFDWTEPRREMIDLDSELKGAATAVRAGLTSRSREIRKFGYDPILVDAEIAEDNRRSDELGLVFDTDPRRMSAQGQAQLALAE